jgi:hypothetical protein
LLVFHYFSLSLSLSFFLSFSSNVRELRRRLDRDGVPSHMLGPDPEQWRKDANKARKSEKNVKIVRKLRNMMVGH